MKDNRKELVSAYKNQLLSGGVYVIKNNQNGKKLLLSGTDLKGSLNRFDFCRAMGTCTYGKLISDWNTFGADAFTFEILEEIIQKETNTPLEFSENLKALEEIYREKIPDEELY